MKWKTLRRIARATMLVCILVNLFALYSAGYAVYYGGYLVAVAIIAYIPIASVIEFWIVKRIWTGELLGVLWRDL